MTSTKGNTSEVKGNRRARRKLVSIIILEAMSLHLAVLALPGEETNMVAIREYDKYFNI